MHGSSSVPQEWLKVINEYGGDIKETYGVPVEEIVEGIKYGVRKVNIDTDLRLASTGAIRRYMAQHPSEFDPRKFFAETVKAMRDVCIARYEAFGTAGNASKIKPISPRACSSVTPKVSWPPRSTDPAMNEGPFRAGETALVHIDADRIHSRLFSLNAVQ